MSSCRATNAKAWRACDCTLLLRRSWRAGEFPPPFAGQERVFPVGGTARVISALGNAAAPWLIGRGSETFCAESGAVASWPLAADWLAPEAVEVKR